MIKFSLKVQSYTSGLDQAYFIANDVTYDATFLIKSQHSASTGLQPDDFTNNNAGSIPAASTYLLFLLTIIN